MSELPRPGRLMAFDFGRRRIGVAVSDEGGGIAFALATVAAVPRDKAMLKLAALIREHAPVGLVVGLPIRTDGSYGPETKRCRIFARDLERLSGVAAVFGDERFTTAIAEQSLLEQDVSRKRRRQVVDRVAACLILQQYLDRRKSGP